MTKGCIESALALLILEGVTGSGKSLFKRLVLGLPVPEFSPSTPLAESAVRSMSICQVAVGGGGVKMKWIPVKPEDMKDMVAKAIKDGVPLIESNWGESSELPFTSSQSDPQKLYKPKARSSQESLKSEQEPSPMHADQSSYTFNATFLDAMKNIGIHSELLQRVTKSTTARLIDVDFIYLLDSGGQPPFREMLPHFVQQASAIVLMLKLNERLDFKPTIRYREEGGKVDKGYTSQLTNEQILHQYVQAVQSHETKVFVVGTHKDKEGDCKGENRDIKNKKLLEAFRPALAKQLELYKLRDPVQLIFPVDCTSRRAGDEAVAEEFRKRVMQKCVGEKVKIPLPWFILEQLLQLVAHNMKVSVLSIEECCEAAKKKLHMPRNVCEAAIRYLGKLNIIFYRPILLPGVVFSNAQVILDKITELVCCNHALRTSNESNPDIVSCMNSGEWLEFRDFGQISAKLLEDAFHSHYRNHLFRAADLLKLLEGLLIAAKLESGMHFIPSLLPNLAVEEIASHRVTSEKHPAALVIYYPKKLVPVGVMPSLVVYLQNTCEWKIYEKESGEPNCMKHNCIEFKLPGGKPGLVTLIDSTKFLEVHVKATLKRAAEVCPQIKHDIIFGLQVVHKSLHYDPPNPEVRFLCSGECGNQEVHLATLDDNRESWTCSKDPCMGEDLDKRHKLWLLAMEGKGIYIC